MDLKQCVGIRRSAVVDLGKESSGSVKCGRISDYLSDLRTLSPTPDVSSLLRTYRKVHERVHKIPQLASFICTVVSAEIHFNIILRRMNNCFLEAFQSKF